MGEALPRSCCDVDLCAGDVASDWHRPICSANGVRPTLHPVLNCTLRKRNPFWSLAEMSGCAEHSQTGRVLSAPVHHPITLYGGDKSKQLKSELVWAGATPFSTSLHLCHGVDYFSPAFMHKFICVTDLLVCNYARSKGARILLGTIQVSSHFLYPFAGTAVNIGAPCTPDYSAREYKDKQSNSSEGRKTTQCRNWLQTMPGFNYVCYSQSSKKKPFQIKSLCIYLCSTLTHSRLRDYVLVQLNG